MIHIKIIMEITPLVSVFSNFIESLSISKQHVYLAPCNEHNEATPIAETTQITLSSNIGIHDTEIN